MGVGVTESTIVIVGDVYPLPPLVTTTVILTVSDVAVAVAPEPVVSVIWTNKGGVKVPGSGTVEIAVITPVVPMVATAVAPVPPTPVMVTAGTVV